MTNYTRLRRELEKVQKENNKDFCLFAKNDNMNILEGIIFGPEGSPYECGAFKLEIVVPETYPFVPPSFRFLTKIYHPNIDEDGRICLDLIKMPPAGRWRPLFTIESILIALRTLLAEPNPDDPLMSDIAEEYKESKSEFMRKAKEHTLKHAC